MMTRLTSIPFDRTVACDRRTDRRVDTGP